MKKYRLTDSDGNIVIVEANNDVEAVKRVSKYNKLKTVSDGHFSEKSGNPHEFSMKEFLNLKAKIESRWPKAEVVNTGKYGISVKKGVTMTQLAEINKLIKETYEDCCL